MYTGGYPYLYGGTSRFLVGAKTIHAAVHVSFQGVTVYSRRRLPENCQ